MPRSHWDPFGEMIIFRDAVDRVLRDSALRPGGPGAHRGGLFPVELGETPDGYVVRAQLPGVTPGDLRVTVHGRTLTISGAAQATELPEVRHWLIRDRLPLRFERTLSLPRAVDVDRAWAQSENGVMVLTLPWAPFAEPRRVPVAVAAAAPRPLSSGSSSAQAAPNFAGSLPAAPADPSGAGVHHSDAVSEGSDLSFPASDPPSWTPGRPGGES